MPVVEKGSLGSRDGAPAASGRRGLVGGRRYGPHTLTSPWSSSLRRPWGSAGAAREGGKKIMRTRRKQRVRDLITLFVQEEGQLLDWISLACRRGGGAQGWKRFLMLASVLGVFFSQLVILDGREGDEGRGRRTLWWRGMLGNCNKEPLAKQRTNVFPPQSPL